MEIVVNKCYGGFGISNEALKMLVEMNAKCIDSFTPKSYYGGDNEKNPRHDWEEKWNEDYAKYFTEMGGGFYGHSWYALIYKDGKLYDLDRNEHRTDKDLITVIRKLKDKANGAHAELEIVEIPDGVDWEIDEYDGIESIHEKHRSW